MSRYGGGRATVGVVCSVGVAELQARGLLRDDTWSGAWRWSSGGSASLVADAREVAFLYMTDGRSHRDVAAVEWTPCRFGGTRPWLRCPRCSRRCARVYLRASGAACRTCHRLAYAVQREDASSRAMRRGRKLVARLGVQGQEEQHWAALDPERLPKPKRMRWATYDRLVTLAREAEDRRVLALLPSLERFVARHGGPSLR